MKKALIALSVLLLVAVASAQKQPPVVSQSKLLAPKSTITVHLNGLNCTTSAGSASFLVQSWAWGASNPVDLSSGGGGGAGKPSISELNVQKKFDQCSPSLFNAVTTGKHFNSMTLVQEDSSNNVVVTLTLTDVLVSSWSLSGAINSETPLESVSFAFAKICINEPTSGSNFCYDIATNKSL